MAEKTTAAPRPAPLPVELDAGAEDSRSCSQKTSARRSDRCASKGEES
jgi:hypothetical protein